MASTVSRPHELRSRSRRSGLQRRLHHTLCSVVFVGALALESAALSQTPESSALQTLERIDEARTSIVFEGFVYTPDGSPAEGAVVVTSAGGKAVVDARGHYCIEASVTGEAESVQVTAVGSGGLNLVASTSVGVAPTMGSVRVTPLALAVGSTCSPSWLPTFGGAPGVDEGVAALAVFDDGGGPALYAGGSFFNAGATAANHIARWDGSSWSALGSGMDGDVLAFAEYDDGGGAALYAGGWFLTAGGAPANGVARCDGSSWSAVGSGIGDDGVDALAVYDDGGGSALYASGSFTTAGGGAANSIARWDGSSWSAL